MFVHIPKYYWLGVLSKWRVRPTQHQMSILTLEAF